jgi:hypothetical protein
VIEVAVSEQPGQVRERQRPSRDRFRQFLGARSVLCRAKTPTASPPDRLRAWAVQVA